MKAGDVVRIGADNMAMAKKCLELIRDIAERGACSHSPENVGYALQQLTQVLFERTGSDDILFEPVSAENIPDLSRLYTELDWVNAGSQDLTRVDFQ